MYPHNIVLTVGGEAKLVDFGVARLMNTTQAHEAGLHLDDQAAVSMQGPEQAQGDLTIVRTFTPLESCWS